MFHVAFFRHVPEQISSDALYGTTKASSQPTDRHLEKCCPRSLRATAEECLYKQKARLVVDSFPWASRIHLHTQSAAMVPSRTPVVVVEEMFILCHYLISAECRRLSCVQQHLLAKTLLVLLGRNITLLDIADPSRGGAFVQVLHELAQRVLVALCFAGDLAMFSVLV